MAYWTLLFGFCLSILRRWLGGGFVKCHRIYKNIVYVATLILMYICAGAFPNTWAKALCFLWTIGWCIRYFNHTHGDYWILDDTKPDEGRSWWIDKVLQLLFGKGNYYNFAGNFVGLTLGYLVPALFASLTMPHHFFWLAGITTPLCYLICEFTLQFTGHRTRYAEYGAGFFMGILFFLNL